MIKLVFLYGVSLTPNAKFKVSRSSDDQIFVQMGNKEIAIDKEVAQDVKVALI